MTSPPQSVKKKDAGRIPGPAAISNCVEIVITWFSPQSRLFHTILHGRNSGSFVPSVGSANTLMTALAGTWSTNLALYTPTTASFFALSVRDMTSPTLPLFASTIAGTAGTSASPAMPANVALVLTENVAMRGRGAKGRLYIPNWATNADAGNGSAIAAVQTAMNAM